MQNPSKSLGSQLLNRLQVLQREEQQIVEQLLRLAGPSLERDTQQLVADRNEHFESLRGSVIGYGDIVSPAADPDEWDANR